MISVSNYSVRFFSFKSVGMPLFMVYASPVVCVLKFDLLCFSLCFCFSWP